MIGLLLLIVALLFFVVAAMSMPKTPARIWIVVGLLFWLLSTVVRLVQAAK